MCAPRGLIRQCIDLFLSHSLKRISSALYSCRRLRVRWNWFLQVACVCVNTASLHCLSAAGSKRSVLLSKFPYLPTLFVVHTRRRRRLRGGDEDLRRKIRQRYFSGLDFNCQCLNCFRHNPPA